MMMAVTVTNQRTRNPIGAASTTNSNTAIMNPVQDEGELLTPDVMESKALKQISPDSVIVDLPAVTPPKASRVVPLCDYQVPLKRSSNSKRKSCFAKVGAIDLDRGKNQQIDPKTCYNLPPLRTPTVQTRRAAPKQLRKIPSLPLSKLDEDSAESLSSPASLPRIPKPVPFSNRAQSDNLAQRKSSERRSIFGHYFDHKQQQKRSVSEAFSTREPKPSFPRRPQHNKQSSSCSILESHMIEQAPMDYRMFVPPPEYAKDSPICRRFENMGTFTKDPYNIEQVIVEDVTPSLVEEDLQRKALPPLPGPLRRFCSHSDVDKCNSNSHGTCGGMHGMYPLIKPVSILKPSSFRRSSSLLLSRRQNYNDGICERTDSYQLDGSDQSQGSRSLASIFNLTESYRALDTTGLRSYNAMERKASTTSTSSSTDTPISLQIGVRFDPRVTVTEFEDPVQRIWYNDFELEVLRRETIQLAQKYMISHPIEAEKYNRAFLDPVTDTYRRKALYSLPALSVETVSESHVHYDQRPAQLVSSMSTKSLEELTKEQVKRILIVDPNPSIRSLFCKSMSSMFPNAKIATAQNADRALKLIKKSLATNSCDGALSSSPLSRAADDHRSCDTFDIIVIEQSLYPHSPHITSRKTEPVHVLGAVSSSVKTQRRYPAGDSAGPGLPWNASMPDMKKHDRHHSDDFSSSFQAITKPGSFFDHDSADLNAARFREPQCGSDLTRAIVQLEQNMCCVGSPDSPGAELTLPQSSWSALLIGVSMQPDHDARPMQEAGSDIIWGKPIPRVGDALRNQLLQALLDKRRGLNR